MIRKICTAWNTVITYLLLQGGQEWRMGVGHEEMLGKRNIGVAVKAGLWKMGNFN